jgi:Domain of unknown function (DUF4266)
MKRLFTTCLIAAAAGLAGCATVEPWQRGYLARADMRLDAQPGLDKALGKTYGAKEAAAGGSGVGGGGCGCN